MRVGASPGGRLPSSPARIDQALGAPNGLLRLRSETDGGRHPRHPPPPELLDRHSPTEPLPLHYEGKTSRGRAATRGHSRPRFPGDQAVSRGSVRFSPWMIACRRIRPRSRRFGSSVWRQARLRGTTYEHAFVTFQGPAYGRFRKSLDRGNVTEALSAASELRHVSLLDALELCLLLRDRAPAKYSRAAVRWHSRLAREVPGVTIENSQAVLAALGAIGGENDRSAARALAEVLNGHGFERAGEALIRWARERQLP
jgi:hypothetical protein